MEKLKEKLSIVSACLNEKQRRIFFAAEARYIGRGGKVLISTLTGMSRPTLDRGMKELDAGVDSSSGKIRQSGAGRKKRTEQYPDLKGALESPVEPLASCDPESALRWTIKSCHTLSKELTSMGYTVGKTTVSHLLSELGYSLQSNTKGLEGESHPDRNMQFEFINYQCKKFIKDHHPVISVDTKKKENIGNYKNTGQEYRPKGNARKVNGHDFAKAKASPYGIYDIEANKGFVNVGQNFDTSQFAVNSIRQWWELCGKITYPQVRKILITADSGGSNGYRRRQWKYELQRFADESGLEISVCHFPPGTSKWNKIEHKMFSQISLNWRGQPLVDYETVVNLIGRTKNDKGLTVSCMLDETEYKKGIIISEGQMEKINLKNECFMVSGIIL